MEKSGKYLGFEETSTSTYIKMQEKLKNNTPGD
jgi:hypothetical protein